MITWIKSKDGKYLYCSNNPTIQADLNGNVFSGGCFSGPSRPELKVPEAPKLPTAGELFGEGIGVAKDVAPLAFGARESALGDIATPEKAMQYYSGYGPTSFEDALSNQYFENVWSDTEREIKHGLSLSGMESSPILSKQLGEARGKLGYDIGSYLSNLGNQRATANLSSRLGIDPYSMITPYTNLGATQSGRQASYDWQESQAQAESQWINEMNEYEDQMAFAKSMGSVFGPVAGWGFGGPEVGVSAMGDMLQAGAGMMGGVPGMGGGGNVFQTPMGGMSTRGNFYGANAPQGVIDTGTQSVFR